jgi:hypothetical protein
MHNTLFKNERIRRKPRYSLSNLNRMQATAVAAASASIGLLVFVVRAL